MGVATLSLTAFAFSQVGTPGPANMIMLITGARYGLRVAIPFVCGVILGKQLIIWPIGLGLMKLAEQAPFLFFFLKYLSAAYIIWLAWQVAHTRIRLDRLEIVVPGFFAGILIHPLNPKAWAMIITGFTNFVDPGTSAYHATAIISICFLITQLFCHPVWTYFGERIARIVIGTRAELYLMRCLAVLTVLVLGCTLWET